MLLRIYSSLLVGQHVGMTDQLDLGSARAAVEVVGVPRGDRFTAMERLLLLHRLVLDERREK